MLFNSIDFAIFLPIVFILYWFIVNRNLKLQNLLIVVASYVFYGWWDWRFLLLIVFSTFVDYWVGLRLINEDNKKRRKLLLYTSLLINISLLGFFKYFNFFLDNFVSAFSFFGTQINADSLNIILPVGISFYTFQTLSYTIDVFKRKLQPTKDFFIFSAYVSFFPQLVAGPIERAVNLLPQFYIKRTFEYKKAADGMRQILWGLFKKIVIADNCATFVNDIFENFQNYSGSTLLLGAIFFSIQIYGDFSGYSDIAIGTSKLFGFNLMKNFNYPFFSRDIAEFWRRWHISLSTWFRDYIYIPLGGSYGTKWQVLRNVLIVYTVSGLWHGANWTFIIWGLLNGLFFIPLLFSKIHRKNTNTVAEGRFIPNVKELSQMAFTFLLFSLSLVIFRSENLNSAGNYLKSIFDASFFTIPDINGYYSTLLLTGILFSVEWVQRFKNYGLEIGNLKNIYLRWSIYISLIILILLFGGKSENFIYFQF